jgi:hypothetical protein
MTVEMKQKGARVASQGTTFAQKQKDSGDKKSVHINKSARRIKYLTNKEECQNYGKTGNPAECNYIKECQNCGKTGHPAICCLHKKIVSLIEEDSADEIPGVDSLDVTVVNQPTGVITGPQADPPQDAGHVRCSRNSNAVIDIALDEDPEQQVVA